MFKIPFLKNNSSPSFDDLHTKPFSPENPWVGILSIAGVCLLLSAILSAYLSLKVLDEDSFGALKESKGTVSTPSLNEDRLLDAVEMIITRLELE